MSLTIELPTADVTRQLGRQLAALLRPGDLIILTGGLGAGKTTLTQGIGEGLEVSGRVSSPTFIIARSHRNQGVGPDLVHVDAYRLGSLAELDDLDLDSALDDSVTVVEWGEGLAEGLAEDRLEVNLVRERGSVKADDAVRAGGAPEGSDESADEPRRIHLTGIGPRWSDVNLAVLVGRLAST